jgi:DNA-binding response OmpR family regulator
MKDMKVLLVDDEEEFLDGEEALSYVEDQEPDVMVLDLKMPGIDGMEVLRQVRRAYPKIQVIILTGHGTEKDEEEAKRLGAFDYLEKPVNLEVLVKKMKAAYRRKMEDTMVAATFAEAGDFESAREIMDEDD